MWNKALIYFLSLIVCLSAYTDTSHLYDLTLEQAEAIAIQNNNTVNSLRELLLKAKEGRLITLSKWLPEVNAMSIMYSLEKPSLLTLSKSAFLTQLSLTQAILSTDLYYDVKIADLILEQAGLLLNAALIDALYEVRSAYYQVILDIELIKAAKEKVDLLASLSKQMEDRYKVGTAILYNVNQSKVAIANATTYYYDLIKQRKIDLDQLASILGFIPGDVEITFAKIDLPVLEIEELKDKLAQLQHVFNQEALELSEKIFAGEYPLTEEKSMKKLYTISEIKKWEAEALRYQPNLKVYENYVEIASKEISKRRGEYLPTVSFNANYGGDPSTVQNLPSSKLTNQRMEWGVGLQFNWLIFDGLGRERRIREAKYNKKSKEFEYRQQLQNTYAGVREQIFQIEESVASYVTADANAKLAQQTVTLATDQLSVGYGTIFDYQISVDGFIQAVNNKNKARFDLLKAYYGLRHATGVDLIEYTKVKESGRREEE